MGAFFELCFSLFLDVVFEPLVMAVGNFVLGVFGFRSADRPQPTGFVVAAVGFAVWALLTVVLVWVLNLL
jgi:hypothetical protein